MRGDAVSKSHPERVRGAEGRGAAGLCVAMRQCLVGVRDTPEEPASHGEAYLPASAAPDSSVPLSAGAALPVEALLARSLPPSLGDGHQPCAAANEPTSERDRASAHQPAPHCCAPKQGTPLILRSGAGGVISSLPIVGKTEFSGSLLALDGRAGCSRGAGSGTGATGCQPLALFPFPC